MFTGAFRGFGEDADPVARTTSMPLWSEARLILTTSGPAPLDVWRGKLQPGEE